MLKRKEAIKNLKEVIEYLEWSRLWIKDEYIDQLKKVLEFLEK
tara:strand:- start:8 stop:136 length:129 start_codon:yes stop_codon:yes gene_type:complete